MKKRMIALALMLVLLGSGINTYAISPICRPLSLQTGTIAKLMSDWRQAVQTANRPQAAPPATTPAAETTTAAVPPAKDACPPLVWENGQVQVQNVSLDALLDSIGKAAQDKGFCQSTKLLSAFLAKIRDCGVAKTEPVSPPVSPPATTPATTKPVTTKPVTTEPVTTKPVTTEPVTTKPVTTKPVTTKPVTTKPVTTKPVTTSPSATSPPATSPPVNLSFEEQVVVLVNSERAAAGLAPLTLSAKLSDVAREKSDDMRRNNYFAHQSPTYGSPFDMMKAYGITYRTAGENIAKGYRTPEAVVEAWMNSPGHKANILNPSFTVIGVGYVASGHYWTQMFTG